MRPRSPRVLVAALISVALSSSCDTGRAPAVHPDGPDRDRPNSCVTASTDLDREVCRIMAELRDRYELPGVSAAILEPVGGVRCYAVGEADRDRSTPMTPRTRFLAGSIGKTFVAALALALEAEGKADLDAPASRWVGHEDWFVAIPHSGAWTLRLLLRHMSGIRPHFDEEFASTVLPRFADPAYAFDPIDLVRGLGAAGPGRPPGEVFDYTDTAFDVAAIVLSRIESVGYFRSIERRFLEPLGLADTEPQDGFVFRDLAQGYVPVEIFPPIEWGRLVYEQVLHVNGGFGRMLRDGRLKMNPVSEFGGGGFISNPTDLARWGAAFYGGDLLPGRYLASLTHDLVPDPAPDEDPGRRIQSQHYGLGTWVTESSLGRSFGHGGFFPGYLSALVYFEDLETAVAVQTNLVNPELDLGLTVLDIGEAVQAAEAQQCGSLHVKRTTTTRG